ncbi:O-antigen ligase family protein [Verrucomicrobium spinosum]|uniref:O-antigen ligase family protein n=1 Tax=Verrucomicrobium spinosum TaxID=2736 RepID=UPI0001745E36|nr:O-antigen ligase family protein [Verrucomicrobium spinosum]
MRDYFFEGVRRLDWGLGNPNFTGALIATLMISLWIAAYLWKYGFWLSLSANAVLGACLVHTYSRGSVVALVGGTIVLVCCVRRWPANRIIACVVTAAALVGYSGYLGASKRYEPGFVAQDGSVVNRWAIYEKVPRMMWDAPEGWGAGRASDAYRQWYQETGRLEKYRQLVSSHLTWLVEFGWGIRIAYVLSWAAVIVLCFPGRAQHWLSVPLAVWICFGLSASFSDTAHQPWLWIVPTLSLVCVVVARVVVADWPSGILFAVSAVAGMMLLGVLAVLGGMGKGHLELALRQGIVTIGKGGEQLSVFVAKPDQAVLGAFYGHKLRSAAEDSNLAPRFHIQWKEHSRNIQDVDIAVVSGVGVAEEKLQFNPVAARRIWLINPGNPSNTVFEQLKEHGEVHVLLGAFWTGEAKLFWEPQGIASKRFTIEPCPLAGQYVPNWLTAVLSVEGATF